MTNSKDPPRPEAAYVLGHSERELARLVKQATLIDPITRRFFLDAGLAPGMRVLDVGSGVGDVAFLAAEIVGASGEVVGVDRSVAALEVARSRAARRTLRHVSFREGDAAESTFERPFDAVVGRYVLMFQPDPAGMLRRLARHVRPDGLVVFHEPDWDGMRSTPPVASYDRCCRWTVQILGAYGHEAHMGDKLHGAFLAAGLPAPTMQLMAVVGGGANSTDQVDLVADAAVTLLPEMVRLGIVTAAEVDAATLAETIRRDVIAAESVVVGRSEVGAWSRVRR